MTLTIGTHLLEPDNWDQLPELTIGTHLNWPILKQEKKNVIIKKSGIVEPKAMAQKIKRL